MYRVILAIFALAVWLILGAADVAIADTPSTYMPVLKNCVGPVIGNGALPITCAGGSSSPSLIAGTNVTITGTWPNQTINATGGGGGGTPGGSSGQVQYNNASAFGGFTASGDATINTGTGVITIAAGAVTSAKMAVGAAVGNIANGTVTNAMLANSTISGISLGSNLATLTIGTHLTGSSYNGSGGVTIATDAASINTVSTIVARDGSGNFAAGTITAALNGLASSNLPLAGGTLTGKLNTLASATGAAGLNIGAGAAPTSPANGDVWATTSGVFAQINGGTVGPFGSAGTGCTSSGTNLVLTSNGAGGCNSVSAATLSAGALGLGSSGTPGSETFGNATSGTITVQPVTGALGSVTLSLPAATDTLVARATTDTLINKTISGASNTLSNIATSTLTGALQAAQEPAHTGDMTNTAGSLATTVGSIGGKAVSLGGAFTISGAFSTTLTVTAITSLTLPAGTDTLVARATTDTLINKTISGASNTLSSIALSSLATQAANTVTGNATAGSASPTALAMTSCSTSASAVSWTTSTGFGCNTAINAATLGAATFASPGAIGSTTPNTGKFTTLQDTALSSAGVTVNDASGNLSTVAYATAPDVLVGSSTTKPITPNALYTATAPNALTFGATVTWNAQAILNPTLTLTASTATLAAPTNVGAGQTYVIQIIQDGTGSRTMTWNSAFNFGTALAPTLTTTAGKTDDITCFSTTTAATAAAGSLHCTANVKGF